MTEEQLEYLSKVTVYTLIAQENGVLSSNVPNSGQFKKGQRPYNQKYSMDVTLIPQHELDSPYTSPRVLSTKYNVSRIAINQYRIDTNHVRVPAGSDVYRIPTSELFDSTISSPTLSKKYSVRVNVINKFRRENGCTYTNKKNYLQK